MYEGRRGGGGEERGETKIEEYTETKSQSQQLRKDTGAAVSSINAHINSSSVEDGLSRSLFLVLKALQGRPGDNVVVVVVVVVSPPVTIDWWLAAAAAAAAHSDITVWSNDKDLKRG